MAEDTPTGEPLLILKELCPRLRCSRGPRPDRWRLRQKTLPGHCGRAAVGSPLPTAPSGRDGSQLVPEHHSPVPGEGPRLRRSFPWAAQPALSPCPQRPPPSVPGPAGAPHPGRRVHSTAGKTGLPLLSPGTCGSTEWSPAYPPGTPDSLHPVTATLGLGSRRVSALRPAGCTWSRRAKQNGLTPSSPGWGGATGCSMITARGQW